MQTERPGVSLVSLTPSSRFRRSSATTTLLDGSRGWYRSGSRAEWEDERKRDRQERRDERIALLQEKANRDAVGRTVWAAGEISSIRPKKPFDWEQQSRAVCDGACLSPRTTEDVRAQRARDSEAFCTTQRAQRREQRRAATMAKLEQLRYRHEMEEREKRERKLIVARARLTGIDQRLDMDHDKIMRNNGFQWQNSTSAPMSHTLDS